jgi:hypothetical protein
MTAYNVRLPFPQKPACFSLKARLLFPKSPPAFSEKPACFFSKARLLFPKSPL